MHISVNNSHESLVRGYDLLCKSSMVEIYKSRDGGVRRYMLPYSVTTYHPLDIDVCAVRDANPFFPLLGIHVDVGRTQ